MIIKNMKSLNNYFSIQEKKEPIEVRAKDKIDRYTAKGNVSTISEIGNIINELLYKVWGNNWGIITQEIATLESEDVKKPITPQINFSLNLREVTKGTSPKPKLMDIESNSINGYNTGDFYKTYRMLFDCIVEFNFIDTTLTNCDTLMERFEEVMITYSGYLKEKGISEIFFLKEVPSEYSLKKISCPSKCLYYYIRLERNKITRITDINKIVNTVKPL